MSKLASLKIVASYQQYDMYMSEQVFDLHVCMYISGQTAFLTITNPLNAKFACLGSQPSGLDLPL